jgi:Mn2+/Fe2+ NRAMP family transporter
VDGLIAEVLGEDAEYDLGAAKDGLAQLARFLQLLAQLLAPLVAQLLLLLYKKKKEFKIKMLKLYTKVFGWTKNCV